MPAPAGGTVANVVTVLDVDAARFGCVTVRDELEHAPASTTPAASAADNFAQRIVAPYPEARGEPRQQNRFCFKAHRWQRDTPRRFARIARPVPQ